MAEKELFNFGDKELNVNSLIKNITNNLQSYLNYYSDSIPDAKAFNEKVNYIKEGIKNGNITIDKDNKYHDTQGMISDNDLLMRYALGYVNLIANEQSKKERSLTKSEITKLEENKKLEKEELARQKAKQEYIEQTKKPDFEPLNGWNVALAFAHSFNQNGLIPYDLLQQLVTTDENGNSVYTDLHTLLDKNFDLVSKQLLLFNNTESYINNINLFKQALKDGDLSPQDKFLGMELGFLSSELDKLNNLIKYKSVSDVEQEVEEIEETENNSEYDFISSNPELKQRPLERDDLYQLRLQSHSKKMQEDKNYAIRILNNISFNSFDSPKSIKEDSEEEFKKYLVSYINKLSHRSYLNFSMTNYYQGSVTGLVSTPEVSKFTKEHLQFMDPKLYNVLGLKFFSKYSTTKMYKHFKDLVEKQNKEKEKEKIELDIKYTKYDPIMNVSVRPEFKDGGIIKAQAGVKTPWRLNFDGTTHQMDAIYKSFIENAETYDAKQIAEALNKLNTNIYKPLNFENQDNTLGFKNWNTTFNESGLNNLFGYNENKSDYLGPTTKSRQGFISYLQNLYNSSNPNKIDSIKTGNGSLVFDPNTKLWSYTNWVDPLTKSSETEPISTLEESVNNGSMGTPVLPEIKDLTLKDLNIKKPIDWNPHGVWNSLTGYFANEAANAKKREILKEIPLYLEVMAPEKAFKTAYTYDLEKAKNEILAEANSIQPITSDAATYYAAKNDSIKNARAYATKLDTEINNRILQTKDANADIAYENALNRTLNVNTNAKYRHEWDIEQKQGDIDYLDARNQSFLGLNKEFKHYHVTDSIKKQKERDASMYKHLLTGITTSPSNYINGWTKHHDLIWFKGQNGQLETDLELIEYQQLLSLVNQASSNILDLYNNIKYPGVGQLFTHSSLKEAYNPNKHGNAIVGKKGMKIDKLKIGNYINKLK